MWTVERVKRLLPDVMVRDGKKIVSGRVSGRLNQLAGVWLDNERRYEFAWETIANALNRESVLSV